MTTCLTCANWQGKGVPLWAFKLGMARCAMKSPAVTLNHWAACEQWRSTDQEQIDKRLVWLGRCGVQVRSVHGR